MQEWGQKKQGFKKNKPNQTICPALANAYQFKASQFRRPVVDI